MKQQTLTNTFDNVFYDRYDEVKNYSCVAEVWDESRTIVLSDTDKNIGLFDKTDIIIMYDKCGNPCIITERIFKKNYSRRDWWLLQRSLKGKLKVIQDELGFHISVSYAKDYIDYVHYKKNFIYLFNEEWSGGYGQEKLCRSFNTSITITQTSISCGYFVYL